MTDQVLPAGKTTPPSVLIFDWDNTLADTWPVVHDAMNHTLVSHGLAPWTLAETHARIGLSMRDSFPRLFGADWQAAADTFRRRFESCHLESLVAFSESVPLLDLARAAGLPAGIVSNKNGRFLRSEVAHLGWSDRFCAIIGAEDAARDKPAPDPVFAVLDACGVPAGPHVWFIGDSTTDVDCGRAAGCTTVLIEGPKSAAEDSGSVPDFAVGSLAEATALVRRHCQPILDSTT